MCPQNPLLTVYAWPDELNYDRIRQSVWFNLEVFHESTEQDCVDLAQLIPQSFLADDLNGRFSGKLVYLSLGSIGSMDLVLMRRLIAILGTSAHKYIVSKEPRHEEFELERNLYGGRYLL